MKMSAYHWLQHNPHVARVRLVPSAISLDPDGPAMWDDLWISTLNAEGRPRLQNIVTGHYIDPMPDDLVKVAPDAFAPRSELKHVCVTLARKLVLQGAEATWLS